MLGSGYAKMEQKFELSIIVHQEEIGYIAMTLHVQLVMCLQFGHVLRTSVMIARRVLFMLVDHGLVTIRLQHIRPKGGNLDED